ncbi:porin [Fibrisoma montanum]|uniref:Porin n=1 Tax=Fibrisoma montanum TaxID=2305895 RepID=A0A418MAP9_9BACT|nr:porin [Fibrisoma montanum]RIV23448.1 porin [Fibrisoma montanum]
MKTFLVSCTALSVFFAASSPFAQTTIRPLVDSAAAAAQPQAIAASTSSLTFSGYVEAYYSHDFTAPKTLQERPGFLYNFRRNREVNVNLAFVKAAYTSDRVRGNLAIQVGTYPQYNYAAEQELIKNIFEANAGVKLSASRDLWLDAGIFSSHLGFESAIGIDNWTLTRSLVAENSPYYLAGARLTYNTANGKWTLLGSVVNGWQRVKRLDGYSGPAVSTQVQYRPSDKVTLNWSTFFGSDRPDSLRQGRMYHNLYAIFQPGKLGLILGFDVGADRKPVVEGRRVGPGQYVWYTPVAMLRYSPSDKVRLAGRVEYYDDRNGVIIATGTPDRANGFQTWGYSVNVDYVITPQALFRIEGRTFSSKDPIFQTDNGFGRTNTALTTSLTVRF